jgi:hypothetical protein
VQTIEEKIEEKVQSFKRAKENCKKPIKLSWQDVKYSVKVRDHKAKRCSGD